MALLEVAKLDLRQVMVGGAHPTQNFPFAISLLSPFSLFPPPFSLFLRHLSHLFWIIFPLLI